MDLPITITIAGEWLNSLIFFHDDSKFKCIIDNGQTIITDITEVVKRMLGYNFTLHNSYVKVCGSDVLMTMTSSLSVRCNFE